MMLSTLCISSCGKELSFSKCALTIAWDLLNIRSSVLSASLYINPQYANSAMAVLDFPITRVFKYVNWTSSAKDCEPMAILTFPNHSSYCRGSQLYSDNFHSGNWPFFLLQVIVSANCFIKSAESKAGAEIVRCGGPPQHIGFGKVAPYVSGMIGVTKGGGATC